MPYPKTAKVIQFEKTHPPKRVGEFTPRELQNTKTWSWPAWLVKDGEQSVENGFLLNAAIRAFGCEMNHENLNTMCQWSELTPLLNVIRPPEPHLITPEERTQGEEELAKIEKSWRGDGRIDGPESAPFTVCYNSAENLDKIVDYVNKEFLGVAAKESFLVAFRTLLSKGELTPVKKEQRKTHDAPATSASVRKSQEAWERQHKDQAANSKAQEKLEADFRNDLRTVMAHTEHSTFGEGRIAWGATFAARKSGLKSLREKWGSKFANTAFLPTYEGLVKKAEAEVGHLSPSGGAIGNTGHDPRVIYGGGTITDVPVTAADEAARQERNRQLLSGNVTNPRPKK